MSASSEFILAPRLDERKMKEESKKMEVQLRRASKQAADDFEFWFGKGFEKGAEKGSQKVKSKLGKLQGFMILTGANLASEAIATAAGVAKDIATKAFQGAEEYAQIARERLNEMSDISDTADALGINRGRYAALSAVGISARLDQSDIRGILSGFVGALERPEMASYKEAANQNGIENAFLDFVGTMAKLKPEVAAQYMNDVFGDEDALLASRFMKPFKALLAENKDLTFQNIMDTMLGSKVRTEELDKALNRSDKSSSILAIGDAKAFEKKIIDGVTQGQAQAVVSSEASEAKRIQANLDVLDLKVKGKIIADEAEIAAVKVENSFVKSTISYASELAKRGSDLIKAGQKPINSMETWEAFFDKLIQFGTYTPIEAATGKTPMQMFGDYVEKRGGEINQMMVDIAEKESRNNKTRTDVGPLK
ncbi:hypothetical protein [Vibrio parahaemolyticus]|uniref:hypothetical protein n=1 Tax=Vibrio parahaemolyticus TaxID=670 RepID=UPI0011246441|nr:hypothetical protein [Vibrio parahaemolyticus]MCS0079276.1 hypothetical protein [Vibrio parahaemolyticus]TOA19616.1 hypothetical protein CGK33_02950 [Vibrio parahaemolyticus]TOB76872.1 hypothetical protein CGK00_10480 [Vibrio parahaemolyticus]TOI64830.1 hypothetical protein CGI57_16250 [Vibrio parahaemolyticus]HBC3371538.1 hypothetical protein [Vibrio parahaemolyticus]